MPVEAGELRCLASHERRAAVAAELIAQGHHAPTVVLCAIAEGVREERAGRQRAFHRGLPKRLDRILGGFLPGEVLEVHDIAQWAGISSKTAKHYLCELVRRKRLCRLRRGQYTLEEGTT